MLRLPSYEITCRSVIEMVFEGIVNENKMNTQKFDPGDHFS